VHPSEILPVPDYAALVPAHFLHPPAVRVLPGARSHLGVPYATPPGWRALRLDLHLPEGPGPHPVVVYAHGGSWLGGMPGHGPWHGLPARGTAVASVGYRLAGEVPFPEPVEDLRAAIRWVRSHADRYDLDPHRVAGWGSSAGAYLMTMAALSGERPLGRPIGDGVGAAGVDAVVDHYGPADLGRLLDDAHEPTSEGQAGTAAVLRTFLGRDPDGSDNPDDPANPLRLAGPGAPPFLIVHGDADHRVGLAQSRWLHAGLRAAGVPAELVVLPGADHADPAFFDPVEVERVLAFLTAVWDRAAVPVPSRSSP
jgi:acetyl esterase/lipase